MDTKKSQIIDLSARSGTTRAERAAAASLEHGRRMALALELADRHGGVLTRVMLLDAGITSGQIRSEVERGAWQRLGRHTLGIAGAEVTESAHWWLAVWESGSKAVLDGPTALLAGGLRGWSEPAINVSLPHNASVRSVAGVKQRRLRDLGAVVATGLPRTKPHVAAVRAAQWAVSDRSAATVLAMTVQQRLVNTQTLLAHWETIRYSARRTVLDAAIRDICAGAQSLNELDFVAMCRQRGLPEPTLQAVRTGENGRVYLDALFEKEGVHVEIQGAGHFEGTAGIADALRVNALSISEPGVIRIQIPVLGLRVCPEPFFEQLRRALSS